MIFSANKVYYTSHNEYFAALGFEKLRGGVKEEKGWEVDGKFEGKFDGFDVNF